MFVKIVFKAARLALQNDDVVKVADRLIAGFVLDSSSNNVHSVCCNSDFYINVNTRNTQQCHQINILVNVNCINSFEINSE